MAGILEELKKQREQEVAPVRAQGAPPVQEEEASILQELERQRKESATIAPLDPARRDAPVQFPARPEEFSLPRALAGGVKRGAASVLGLPGDAMDLLEMGLGAIGMPDPAALLPEKAQQQIKPFLPGELRTSAKINQVVDNAMLGLGIDLSPTTQKEEVVQRLLQEVAGAQLSLPVIRAISRTARSVPAFKQALQEIGYSSAGGLAAGVVQQALPDNMMAEIGAQLSPEAAVFLFNLTRSMSGRIPFTSANVRRKAIQALRRTSFDVEDLDPNIRHAFEVKQAIEATGRQFTPSMAETTGSRGMISIQAGFEAKGADTAARIRFNRMQNIDAATDAISDTFQRGDVGAAERAMRFDIERAEGRVARATESAQARAARAQRRIDNRLRDAEEMLGNEVGRFGTDAPTASGRLKMANEVARKSVVQARRSFRSEAARRFENVDPSDAVAGPIDEAVTLVQHIEQQAIHSFDEQHVPRSVREFLRSIKKRAMQARGDVPRSGLTQRQIAALPDNQLELQEFIRRKGGINLASETDLRGEFEALIRNRETGTSGLFRTDGGLTPQEMAELAVENGFILEADKFELLDAVRASRKSGKVYAAGNHDVFNEPELFDPLLEDAINKGAITPEELQGVEVTLNDLQRARSNALMEGRALSGPDVGTKQRMLDQYIDILDRRMESLAVEAGDAAALDRLRDARDFFRQNVRKFRAGAGAEILAQRNGEYRVKNAQVLRKILGSNEDIDRFIRTVGEQDGKLILQEYLDNEVYLRAVTQKTEKTRRISVNQSKLKTWMAEREDVFRRYPDLRQRYVGLNRAEEVVQRVDSAGKRLSQRATRRLKEDVGISEAQDALQANPSRQYLEAARGERDITIELATERVMRAPDPNRQILRTLDSMPNENIGEGLMRSVWDRFLTQEGRRGVERTASGHPMITPRNMKNFIDKYRPSLERVYGKAHVKNLDLFADGITISRRAERIPMRPGSETAELLQTRLTAMQPVIDVASFTAGPFTGFLIRHASRRVRAAILGMTRREVEEVMNEMLFDVDIANTIKLIRDGEAGVRVIPRLRAHLTMLGAGTRLDQDEPTP